MKYQKPSKLQVGDTVAVISPSWGGPSVFPHVYENGLKILKKWGLKIKEYPSTRLEENPSLDNVKLRAKDVNDAFSDKEVKAIFTSIGGDDSVRLLPYLDTKIISDNPKIFMGYSDTTTMLTLVNQLGMVTFNGPSVMAGFSQMEALPDNFEKHVHDMLFETNNSYKYPFYGTYCDGYADWSNTSELGKTKELKLDNGMRVIQGKGIISGVLFGGCIEVLEFMKGTKYWPNKDFWHNKILFLETSEEKPSLQSIRWMLRNYGVQGVFDRANGIIFGRARDYSDTEKQELDFLLQEVISVEFGNSNFPIITNAEFGHTDPQIVLPNGVEVSFDLEKLTINLNESCIV